MTYLQFTYFLIIVASWCWHDICETQRKVLCMFTLSLDTARWHHYNIPSCISGACNSQGWLISGQTGLVKGAHCAVAQLDSWTVAQLYSCTVAQWHSGTATQFHSCTSQCRAAWNCYTVAQLLHTYSGNKNLQPASKGRLQLQLAAELMLGPKSWLIQLDLSGMDLEWYLE